MSVFHTLPSNLESYLTICGPSERVHLSASKDSSRTLSRSAEKTPILGTKSKGPETSHLEDELRHFKYDGVRRNGSSKYIVPWKVAGVVRPGNTHYRFPGLQGWWFVVLVV